MDDITTIQPYKLTPMALRSETSGELYKLSGEMVVGREVECDIQLASLQVSRYHAKISVSANGVFVEDLHSSNGTFVNGRKVSRRTALSMGDRLAFDDLVFRVTSQNSGGADETKIMSSGSLSKEHIEDINSIASDKLRPAADNPQELARARAAMQARQQAKSSDTGKQKALGAEHGGPPSSNSDYPGIQPIPKEKAHKVHEIPDMEAFLEFAGSGLKPQEPLSKKEASPFGLSHSKPVAPRGEAPVDRGKNPNKPVPLEPEKTSTQHSSLPMSGSDDDTRPITPEESAELLRQAQAIKARAAAEERVAKNTAAPAPAPELAPAPPQVGRPDMEEDDSTRYLSMSTMDRYAETNARGDDLKDTGSGPRIVAMTAPIRGKVFQLVSNEDVQCWTIGRDDSADVCIRDKAVSREHAWITKLDAFYQLTVNDQASEIFVNGVTAAEANLKHGDRLQFGAMELIFRLDVKTATMPAIKEGKQGFFATLKALFSR